MKKILLDVDEVICFSGFLEAVNDFLGTNYEIDDFTEYYIDVAAVPENRMEEFAEFVNNRNLYKDANILPDAIETIEKLNKVYDIYICSSCVNSLDVIGSGRIFKDKYDFLVTKLPFLDPQKFIFTNTKNLFKADIQIDDRLSNLGGEIETKILFPSYHNREITDDELKKNGVIRAGNNWKKGWHEVEKILIKNKKEYNFSITFQNI